MCADWLPQVVRGIWSAFLFLLPLLLGVSAASQNLSLSLYPMGGAAWGIGYV
jgi:hypothetical protein